jgi:hypothetical protein
MQHTLTVPHFFDHHFMKKILISAFLTCFSLLVEAQLADSCKLRIGTNLSGPSDYGSEWPFVNIMKYGRTWTPHNNTWVSGGVNAWDSGLLDQIPLDADGYPLSLPVEVPGAEAPQIVRTLWANTDALPVGKYVVLYDGEGDLDVWGDASVVSKSPGRMEINVTHGADIFTLDIKTSTLGNHVRNMRVLLPGTENTYQTNPFSAEWLEKLEPFKALRFMDWGYTNNSTMRDWSQRTRLEDYTWTQKSGVPYEMWTTVCNLKGADAWVCVPHGASPEYIAQMATHFRDNLHPDLKIYVEWSNEVWNWIFSQAHYGLDSLDQNLVWPERLGPKIAEVMQIWTDVFAGQEHRLVRIMASQHAWWDLGERTFAQIKAGGKADIIDAISCAAYMGLNGSVQDTWDASMTGTGVLDHAADFTFDNNEYAMRGWHAYSNLARQEGKQLLFYEGGQHFTPNPFGSEQPYCPALLECQTLPAMYDLYQQLFDTLRTLSSEEMLLMNFSFVSPLGCRYGSWGLLQSQFDEVAPFTNAPKYRAVLDANATYLACQSSVPVQTPTTVAPVVYPNPAQEMVTLEWRENQQAPETIKIYNTLGQCLRTIQVVEADLITVSLVGLPSGVLILDIAGNAGQSSVRVIHE